MVIHLEELSPPVFLCRIGNKGWHYGEPYKTAFVVKDWGDGVAEICGVNKSLTISETREVVKTLRERGFTKLKIVRHNRKERLVKLTWNM